MTRTLSSLLLALVLAPAAGAVELSGTIRSSAGFLPGNIAILATPVDGGAVIAGTLTDDRYRIDLPSPGQYSLRLQASRWDAEPKLIYDSKTAGALDFLIYPVRIPEPALAQELIRMAEQDQAGRSGGLDANDPESGKRLAAQDAERERRLASIVDEKGWPAISQVGHKAAASAWLIAQHGTPEFLQRCLVLMQAAAQSGEITPARLALSIDRVLTANGQPQRYGSQFRLGADGRMQPFPIEDMKNLDARRASMGLEPFEDYRKQLEN